MSIAGRNARRAYAAYRSGYKYRLTECKYLPDMWLVHADVADETIERYRLYAAELEGIISSRNHVVSAKSAEIESLNQEIIMIREAAEHYLRMERAMPRWLRAWVQRRVTKGHGRAQENTAA